MNQWRRRILAGYLAFVFLAVIYVPWKEESVYYNIYRYAWLFDPPRYKAEIAYGMVVLEVIAISIVVAALVIFQDIVEPRWRSFLEWLAKTKEPRPLTQFYLSLRERFRSKRP